MMFRPRYLPHYRPHYRSRYFFHDNMIIERLDGQGVPLEYLERRHAGVAVYYKDNRSKLPGLFSAILPTIDDDLDREHCFSNSMFWLQWLMFERDPGPVLEELATVDGVCGALSGEQGRGYRCRTCRLDHTHVICESCFQNGDHNGHDYFIMSGTFFCDCGDVTSWKREGFCSKHNGAEEAHIQPISNELAESMGPLLDLLFVYWKEALTIVETCYQNGYPIVKDSRLARSLRATLSITEMLLELSNCNKYLLSFVSERMALSVGLLDILVRAKRFLLHEDYANKVQELTLKMLSNPTFQFKFAMPFLNYYSTLYSEAAEKCSDAVFKKGCYGLFSAKIFTVPILTLNLVKESDLLVVLLKCLDKIFTACAGEDGRFQVNKWANLHLTATRVLEDVRYVMSHAEVAKYIIHEGREIMKMWFKLMAFVQGMDSQKRGIHGKGNKKNACLPYALNSCISSIHSLLVAGGFCESSREEFFYENLLIPHTNYYDDGDSPRLSKVRKLSCSVMSAAGRNSIKDSTSGVAIVDYINLSCEPIVSNLTNNCLRAIESWLRTDNVSYDVSSAGKIMETELADLPLLSLPYWPNISYDVSSAGISVYIPLHRLLSNILQRAARKCYVECNLSTTVSINSLAPVPTSFFGKVLVGCHPNGFSSFVMEHPLRLRVVCAQIRAGMRRKNGAAANISFVWYRSVRWSEEAMELDLFLLQCCAALAPADPYVTRLLERFGLSTYLDLDNPHSNAYEPVLMRELLTLLIQIVKERRFCGLSENDSLQREFVRMLAIRDATRSDLVKSLPGNLSRIDGLQEVLDQVAIQSDLNQGLYTLRSEYWKELDLYHPYWNPKDLQIVEGRYLQFCQTSALTSQLPKWTNTYEPFNEVAKIATCKVVLEIVRAVLFYGVHTDRSRAPDSVVLTALHLLSLALDICIQRLESTNLSACTGDSFPIYAFASEKIFTGHAYGHGFQSLLSLLEAFMRMHRKESLDRHSEAGSISIHFSSLVENLLKKFQYIDSGCVN